MNPEGISNIARNQLEIDLKIALTKIMADHGTNVLMLSYLKKEGDENTFGLFIFGLGSRRDLTAMHANSGKSLQQIVAGKVGLTPVEGDMN